MTGCYRLTPWDMTGVGLQICTGWRDMHYKVSLWNVTAGQGEDRVPGGVRGRYRVTSWNVIAG